MNHCLLFGVTSRISESRMLGPHRIAHYLREHGMDAEVIDWAYFWKLEELKELAKNRITNNTVFIGFGHIFDAWNDTLEQFCMWFKKQWPNIKIISGAAVKPQFKSDSIDYYIAGYGEHAILELVKYISGNGARPRFWINAPKGKKIIDALDQYPAYPMQSLMVKYQDRDFLKSHEWLGIEFSRGCKFSCDFCNFPVIGVKGDYSRSAEDFDEQIRDAYDRFGISNYHITDETFNDRTEKITKFADVVEKLPFDPYFTGYIRADLLIARKQDRSELRRMRMLGHYYGVESFNTPSAKSVGKGMAGEKLKEGLVDIKNYYTSHEDYLYRGTISLILGLPHETIDSLMRTKQWLIDNWQGQSFLVYPLVIQKGELVKPSKLSLNYTQYGYRPMALTKNLDPMTKNFIQIDTVTLWENDHMNYYIAEELVKDFVEIRKSYHFPSDNFELAKLSDVQTTLKDKLQAKYNGIQFVTSVQDYINKKLSL